MSSAPASPPPAAEPKKPSDFPFLDAMRNPAARTYALISAGGLLATATLLYLFYFSMFGAGAVLVIGACGLLFRWASAPVLFVVVSAYSLRFPLGLPFVDGGVSGISLIPGSHFALADLLFVAAALIHLIGLYRYLSAAHAGLPFEAPPQYVKPGAKPTVRPAEPIPDPELWKLFARAAAFVVAGQVLWLLVTELKLDFRRDFPITVHDSQQSRYGPGIWMLNWLSRSLLTVLAFAVLGGLLAFVMWYWRLAGMSRDEGRVAVLDTRWAGLRRDVNRPEAWRGWVKKKAAGKLPKKGFGTYFLVFGVPMLMLLFAVVVIGCAGGFR